jgi:SAM-dependent methyltransferase
VGYRITVLTSDIFVDPQSPRRDSGLIENLAPRELLRALFHLFFGREPDLSDDGAYVRELESGAMAPRQLLEWFIDSAEWSHLAPMTELGPSLHYGRGVFIRSLPRGARILDIGGAAVSDPGGGLVLMGYPYQFDELVIVDLPNEDRHPLYQSEIHPTGVQTAKGVVTYRYHSMTHLSGLSRASFDLVYSGQSIEHVTRRDADEVLGQVRRLLKPGGVLALDTPNRKLTRLQGPSFVDPDHKYEYTHREMVAMLRSNGFVIERSHGISYGGDSVTRRAFDAGELATKRGLFDEIDDCYLIAYVCRRTGRLDIRAATHTAWLKVFGGSSKTGALARRIWASWHVRVRREALEAKDNAHK